MLAGQLLWCPMGAEMIQSDGTDQIAYCSEFRSHDTRIMLIWPVILAA